MNFIIEYKIFEYITLTNIRSICIFGEQATGKTALIERIKNDINRSLSTYRQGQNKYHLGTISDILGYVNAAAAAGLAGYHLYKYRKKYGLK